MSKKLPAIIIICTMVFLGFWVMNSNDARDFLQSFGYVPSDEVKKIEEKLKLTNKGEAIFNASRPVLDSREDFNRHCSSYDEQISVLGCYTGGGIYVYNIKTPEIDGVRESTMAHELLHAVWGRLNEEERQILSASLWQVYSEHHELAEDLDIYDDKEKLDELHSRVGTQIVTLPVELEMHYAKYFNNQDDIVAYYLKYDAPFREINGQLDRLSREMDDLSIAIEAKTAEYKTRSEALAVKIQEFNACANQMGCFRDEASFNIQHNTLVVEQNEVSSLYTEINQLTDLYNAKVTEYNNNILRTKDLQNSINSNSAPPTV